MYSSSRLRISACGTDSTLRTAASKRSNWSGFVYLAASSSEILMRFGSACFILDHSNAFGAWINGRQPKGFGLEVGTGVQYSQQDNLCLTLWLMRYGNYEGPASFPIVLGVDSITVPVRVPRSIYEPIPGRDGLLCFPHDPGISFPPARYALTGVVASSSPKLNGKFPSSCWEHPHNAPNMIHLSR